MNLPTARRAARPLAVALLLVAAAGCRRARHDAPAPAAANAFQLEPYVARLAAAERTTQARLDETIGKLRGGWMDEAQYDFAVVNDVLPIYAKERDALRGMPAMPQPMQSRIDALLAYANLRGELWLTAAHRAPQPNMAGKPLLTDEEQKRLAAARAKTELDTVKAEAAVTPP